MGGGDLNQKKSWHPQTTKNQEKVWKAEQNNNQEVQKLNELRKEIEEEKNREVLKRIGQTSGVLPKNGNESKLEWMYKSSTELVNREEYLLGRTIDKTFEMLQDEEEHKERALVGVKVPVNHVEHECIPFSIRAYRNLESTEQVDLQRKISEDPLMLIKQREMESRRKLLENPVKLKELHRILKTEQTLHSRIRSGKDKKAKKSKKSKKAKFKKAKKSKKHFSTHSASAESDLSSESISNAKDLDAELEKRYQKLFTKDELKNISLSRLLNAKYETISRELDKAVRSKDTRRQHHQRNPLKSREPNKDRELHIRDHSFNNERGHSSQGGRKERVHSSDARRNERCEYNQKMRSRSSRSKSISPVKRRHRVYSKTFRSRISRSRTKSRSPNWSSISRPSIQSKNKITASKRSSNSQQQSKSSAKISEEDKEKRLQEMRKNAAWRDEVRSKTVQKLREEDAKEEARNKVREFDREFASNQLRKAMSNHTSVEACIRSNIKNIQRTSGAMNKNFTRK